MPARIYRPTRTAMQSGRARTKAWVLEFEPASARRPDPLMGWSSSSDMNAQVRLPFESEADASAYAEAHGIAVEVVREQPRRHIIKAYADNFSADRREPWTH
jgi:hypothetical protein